ncbi:MAG: aminodeoxychorismate synthase component I [Gammaproteobacteria bacterium]|nr:aminodeoxychorismate synthase component I [Gammaproteobacteria bacterium]
MQTDTLEIHSLPYPGRAGRLAYFERIRSTPWAILLDSGGGAGPNARYDILSAWPHTTLRSHQATTFIEEPTGTRTSPDDPFALLQQALGERRPNASGLPFAGGALGYFAYDLGRRVEKLPSIAEADLALPDMAVGLYDWALIIDHEQESATLVRQRQDRAPAMNSLIRLFEGAYEAAAEDFRLTGPWAANMDRAAYGRAFRAIQDYIRAGDCYQVNLAQRWQAPYEGSAWAAWRQLAQANAAPFSAYMKLDEGEILSLSPERFLRVENDQALTEPIKGTRPRGADGAEDARLAAELQASEKDRAENVMIVDLLRNDLGKSCAVGTVRVPELFGLHSFPAVHHLISTVTGTLAPGKTAVDLLRGAFPGGSITGAPKVRAMEIIEELEPHRRCVYCGAIGYIGYDGRMDTNIAIRSLVATRGRLQVWAGGGLVADSEEEAEYQETFHKLGKILPVLNEAQGPC